MADQNGFTPTQRRMLAVLADGKHHHPNELHACLHDDQGDISNIYAHISLLRKALGPRGEDIACERISGGGRRHWYRQVRLLASAYDGKR